MVKKFLNINFLREFKHYIYVNFKNKYLLLRYVEPARDIYQKMFPTQLTQSDIDKSFLRFTEPKKDLFEKNTIPKKIFIVWAGDNELSTIRIEAIEEMRRVQSDIEIVLVNPENIHQFILPERPLHDLYNKLSYVHRSDYLRVYLLWAYGGGYCDIKKPLHNWSLSFKDLEESSAWIVGYPEITYKMIGEPKPFGNKLKRMSSKMIGQGAFIARSKTPFLEEWLNEMDRVLERHRDNLEKVTSTAYGTEENYPLYWTELLADILHPLCAKYEDKIIRDKRILFNYKGYGHR